MSLLFRRDTVNLSIRISTVGRSRLNEVLVYRQRRIRRNNVAVFSIIASSNSLRIDYTTVTSAGLLYAILIVGRIVEWLIFRGLKAFGGCTDTARGFRMSITTVPSHGLVEEKTTFGNPDHHDSFLATCTRGLRMRAA